MAVSEAKLIEALKSKVWTRPELSLGFRDDCARLPAAGPGEATLVTTDSLMEDIHFRRAAMTARDLGWKALAVNLSDLASKGARPTGFFLNWSLPNDVDEGWLEEFIEGLGEAARHGDCPLLGGDTTGSPGRIVLTITATGVRAGEIPYRTGARPGDVLVATGTLGLSALGLSVQEDEWEGLRISGQARAQALRKHHRPEPRLREGAWLASRARAMMDLSDGIFRDVPRLAAASGLEFELRDLPLAAELRALADQDVISLNDARAFALYGGEDYELLAALPAADAERVCREFVEHFGIPLSVLGELRPPKSSATSFVSLGVRKPSTRFATLSFAHFAGDREDG